MTTTEIVSAISVLVAAFAAWAAQRAAAKASIKNTDTTSRVDMEKEAYERARAFDTETIKRQDAEIEELRMQLQKQAVDHKTQMDAMLEENKEQKVQIRMLRLRVERLERDEPT